MKPKSIDSENTKNISQNDEEKFNTEKTKSLSKFPTNKIINNNDFTLDVIPKNFSKSLKFNFPGHFAPKLKIRYSNKIPAPLFFKKYNTEENLKEDIENENALSEKDASFDSDSIESDSPRPEINEIASTESKSTIENNMKQKKVYWHYSIGIFNSMKSQYEFADHKTIREWRSNLFNIKNNDVKKFYKEMEYKISEKSKNKYGLDIVKNNTKKEDICKIIEIHAMEHKEEEEEEGNKVNMNSFRNTISYNTASYSKQLNKIKGFTIMDILMHKRSTVETTLKKIDENE